jgi:hypothetical protein
MGRHLYHPRTAQAFPLRWPSVKSEGAISMPMSSARYSICSTLGQKDMLTILACIILSMMQLVVRL